MRSSSLYKNLFVFSLFIFSFFYPFGANADFLASSTAECKAYEGTCVKSLICPGETHDGGDCDDWSITDPHNCCFPNVSTSAECTSNGGVCDEKLTVSCPDKQVLLGTCAESKTACCKSSSTSTLPPVSSSYSYTPLEPIPGFEVTDPSPDFPRYLVIIYNFGIWGVGIAAMFMIIVGSFWYLTAAGNNAQLATAKKIIFDALIGLVVAFSAWLILFIINPDLTTVDLKSLSKLAVDDVGPSSHSSVSRGASISGPGNGTCEKVGSGPCSVSSLRNSCLGSNAEAFSRLCNKESRGGVGVDSGTDVCDNYGGQSFSGGLFQINVLSHGRRLGDPRCNNLGSKGSCAPGKRRPSDNVCLGWNCELNDSSGSDLKYCMDLTHTAEGNIQMACSLSGNGVSMNDWACSANKCGLGGTSGKLKRFCAS